MYIFSCFFLNKDSFAMYNNFILYEACNSCLSIFRLFFYKTRRYIFVYCLTHDFDISNRISVRSSFFLILVPK